MSDPHFTGYTVAYDRDEAPFPVYLMAFLAAVLFAGAVVVSNTIMFALGAAAFAVAYYNFPLVETGRPRLGANQYGVFIEGFGLIRWSAIDKLDLAVIAVRAMTLHELHITLKLPLTRALVTDWRRVPVWRMAMRLPWSMTPGNIVRVSLDAFDREPEEVHATLMRMWRYYRS